MDIDETTAAIRIMNAYLDNETIQFRYRGSDNQFWSKLLNPVWDFYHYEYRIKGEKPSLYLSSQWPDHNDVIH